LTEFFFATGNDHKIQEAKAAVAQFGIEISKFGEFQKIEIQNPDLEEIANTALSLIIQKSNKPIFVEDSGLFIHHLSGFPGPYSSFVFETLGVEGILKLMEEAKTRKAEFRSSVSFGTHGKWFATFSSATEGTIQLKPRGTNGFGFDPIFVPMWTSKTFSEMELKEKTVYSHRAKAISKLALWYLNEAKKNPDLKDSSPTA
jgi:XTP/dITP diphosphohydrolase